MMLRTGRRWYPVILLCGLLTGMSCGNPAPAINPAQQKALQNRLDATGHEAAEYATQAAVAAEAGDGKLVVESTLAGLEIVGKLNEEPILLCQIVRLACQSKCLDSLAHGLASVQLSDEQLKELAVALEQSHDADALDRAAETELQNAANTQGCTGFSTRRMMQPAVDRAKAGDKRGLALYRAAQTVLAIERFRVANNRLPNSLDELAPDFIETVPIDPFTDALLGYVKLEPGYAVHSAGEDGKLDEQLVKDAESGGFAGREEQGMVIRR